MNFYKQTKNVSTKTLHKNNNFGLCILREKTKQNNPDNPLILSFQDLFAGSIAHVLNNFLLFFLKKKIIKNNLFTCFYTT